MIIAVASGKGGTGKTTVAVSLALSLADLSPIYLDCDVEEPNAALFLHPELTERRDAGQNIPVVDPGRCTACGRCAAVCRYHAIVVVGQQELIFPELCHGCGSCTHNCPAQALHEVFTPQGVLERGRVLPWDRGLPSRSSSVDPLETPEHELTFPWNHRLPGRTASGEITFAQGTLAIGTAKATPIIRQLKQWVIPTEGTERPVILDAPPGTACPVVETLRGADLALMVTEPTPFGLHDLRQAVEVARDQLGLPIAVIINRDGVGTTDVDAYCAYEGLPIVLRIPLERAIAEGIAQGRTLIEIHPEYRAHFRQLFEALA